jgi:hypothetical protein
LAVRCGKLRRHREAGIEAGIKELVVIHTSCDCAESAGEMPNQGYEIGDQMRRLPAA